MIGPFSNMKPLLLLSPFGIAKDEVRLRLQIVHRAVGTTGSVGLGLLVSALGVNAYHLVTPTNEPKVVAPTVRSNQEKAMNQVAIRQSLGLENPFPTLRETSAIVKNLKQLASVNHLPWKRASYQYTQANQQSFAVYEIASEFSGPYVDVRRLIGQALNAEPALSIKHITFKRSESGAQQIEAQIDWVVYLSDGWQASASEARQP